MSTFNDRLKIFELVKSLTIHSFLITDEVSIQHVELITWSCVWMCVLSLFETFCVQEMTARM